MTEQHLPVMLDEAIAALDIQPQGTYIDATFGRGGHSQAILQQLNENGRLISLDKDPEAIAYGQQHFQHDTRLTLLHRCFSELPEIVRAQGLHQQVQGLLLDLGVSSPQLDNAERGFSFMREGPLDMRMNPERGESAASWINRATVADMAYVIKRYGEESFAKKIAFHIDQARTEKPIETTKELARIVDRAVPYRKKGIHPATKTFQAIRIHINQELAHLEHILPALMDILAPGGRLVVISFHSLEDRIVKQWCQAKSKITVPKGLAILEKDLKAPFTWVNKRIKPSELEIQRNARSRSAVMRVAQKCETA